MGLMDALFGRKRFREEVCTALNELPFVNVCNPTYTRQLDEWIDHVLAAFCVVTENHTIIDDIDQAFVDYDKGTFDRQDQFFALYWLFRVHLVSSTLFVELLKNGYSKSELEPIVTKMSNYVDAEWNIRFGRIIVTDTLANIGDSLFDMPFGHPGEIMMGSQRNPISILYIKNNIEKLMMRLRLCLIDKNTNQPISNGIFDDLVYRFMDDIKYLLFTTNQILSSSWTRG